MRLGADQRQLVGITSLVRIAPYHMAPYEASDPKSHPSINHHGRQRLRLRFRRHDHISADMITPK